MTKIKTILSLIFILILTACSSHHFGSAPDNPTAQRIHAKLSHYQQLSRQNWSSIHVAKLPLKQGMRTKAVQQIRHRLVLLGDLPHDNRSALFDSPLKQAIRQFQWRHGLKADGIVGSETLKKLNIHPKQRLAKLKSSMDKWAKFPSGVGSHYIRGNVANFELDLIKNNEKVINMKVVAGKPTRKTPEIYSKVETIVLNPKWNVPSKIAKRDIIPKIIENPDYLKEENISIYSSWAKDANQIDPTTINWQKARHGHFPYRFSQAPGDNNALGRVKFVFLNDDDVYMHDTPQKGLFAKLQRAFSSGCIRLERPFELVEYFIQDNPGLTHDVINEKLNSGTTQYVRIKNVVPIYITYITAWVDKNGFTHFREDIYKHNKSNT